jgi:hypothetical protein
MNRILPLLLLTVTVVTVSCSKKTVPVAPATPKTVLNIEEIDFEYFHGRARMILRDASKEREVKANIRIRKDSVIWFNFTVLGVQGGRALINKDSITILSNVDNEYFVFDYPELSKRFNMEINYNVIQAAMLGNTIIDRKETDGVAQESSMFLLKQEAGDIGVTNYVNAASQKIEKVEMKETNSMNSLVINYSNFQPVGNKIFPYNGTINLFYKTVAGLLNTTIIFEYSKAEVGDRELKFPFKIPNRYERR